jgi:NMD protein affecting ribosome stability and mRNA decay
LLSEWDKAKQAIEEIEKKEQDSLNMLLDKLRKDLSKESIKVKNELIRENSIKIKKLNKIKEKLKIKEEKYLKNEEEERFKIKFKIIKDEIDILT